MSRRQQYLSSWNTETAWLEMRGVYCIFIYIESDGPLDGPTDRLKCRGWTGVWCLTWVETSKWTQPRARDDTPLLARKERCGLTSFIVATHVRTHRQSAPTESHRRLVIHHKRFYRVTWSSELLSAPLPSQIHNPRSTNSMSSTHIERQQTVERFRTLLHLHWTLNGDRRRNGNEAAICDGAEWRRKREGMTERCSDGSWINA